MVDFHSTEKNKSPQQIQIHIQTLENKRPSQYDKTEGEDNSPI